MHQLEQYVGVWRDGLGSGGQWVEAARDWTSFKPKNEEYFSAGFCLAAIGSYHKASEVKNGIVVVPAGIRYTGVWRPSAGGAQWVSPAMNWDDFRAQDKAYFDQGLRLVALNLPTGTQYVGVWQGNQGLGAQWVNQAAEWPEFAAMNKEYVAAGLRLVAISGTRSGLAVGGPVYTGVWRGGQGAGHQRIIPGKPLAEFFEVTKELFDNGFRLVAISSFFDLGNELKLTGVFRADQGAGAQWVNAPLDWDNFKIEDKQLFDQGHRLVALTVSLDQSVSL